MRIRVVPHFMRLHEWIALDECFFEVEGLEPEVLTEAMHDVSMHRESPYFQRPQDRPFIETPPVEEPRGLVDSQCCWSRSSQTELGR